MLRLILVWTIQNWRFDWKGLTSLTLDRVSNVTCLLRFALKHVLIGFAVFLNGYSSSPPGPPEGAVTPR